VTIGGICVVKDEEEWIYYAISSIKPYVDRFIVVDGGSTDRTMSEIRRAGITPSIIGGTLTEKRNAAAELTGCDWIWWIDGDEVWTNKDAESVVEYIKIYADNPDISILRPHLYRFIGDRFHYDIQRYSMSRIYRNCDVKMYGKSFPHCCDALARSEEDLDIVKGPYTVEARVDKPYVLQIDATFYHYAECGSLLHRKSKWYNYIRSAFPHNDDRWVLEKLQTVKWGVSSDRRPFLGPQPEVFG